jgi:hypothetical protein
MLFDKIIEVLTALVVAIAGIAGINTAAEHADPPANDAALKEPAGLSRAADARNEPAEVGLTEQAGLGPADGLAQALEALAQAMESAPDEADQGLETATEAVTESPANDAPAGPPEGLPAGPPADLPGGRP